MVELNTVGDSRATAGKQGSAIRAAELSKAYGDRLAVDRLTFEVPRGVVASFVGPNGAGKTTTMRMLLSMVKPTGGKAEVLGEPINQPTRYLRDVGALIEAPAFYPSLSGRRNLEVLLRLGGIEEGRLGSVLPQVDLVERSDDLYSTYSLGMKQRLAIAAALLPDPALLLLDEPTNGLDPAGITEIRALLRRLADCGTTVFVSSHLLAEVEQISDWLVMIKGGQLLYQGPTAEALASQRGSVVAYGGTAEAAELLLTIAERAGHSAQPAAGGRVRIDALADFAPELNKAAMASGVVLSELRYERPGLEEMFLKMTGDDGEDEHRK